MLFLVPIGCDRSTTTNATTTATSTTGATTSAATTATTTNTQTTVSTIQTIISTTQTTTQEQSTTYTTLPTTSATTTELDTTLVEYTSIEITQQYTKFFRLNEAFDKNSIQLTAHKNDNTTEIIPSSLISVRGYSSTTPGEKTLFIIFDRFLIETTVYILEDFAFPIDMPYYEQAINLKGDYLKVVLNNIIHENFIPLLYGDARYILPESDVDPNNASNIMLVYTGYSVDSTWDGGLTWNREHTWPQSRLGVSVAYGDADFPSKATDIHNLKPADPDENAVRSNDYFGDVDGLDIYVPRDEVKGDIARILFYMATAYFDLTLDDEESTLSAYKTMGFLSLLIEWNEMDPVDDFERHRNDVLYSYQGNRNPYIDYPEFVNLIWGDTAE